MVSAQPFVLHWGIISTGRISAAFVKDVLIDPKTRDVHDIVHKVTAVGSRSLDSAVQFVANHVNGDPSITAYGSYAEVYGDSTVDVIYIGTPHTVHYENALDGTKAKKHVLCEKPVTSNAAELRSLLATAREQGVFFMEALWTRFQPLTLEVKKIVESGVLGDPVALMADLSVDFNINTPIHTLNSGPHSRSWCAARPAILALYEHPSNKGAKPLSVTGTMLKTPLTGVDRSTSFTVTFSPGSPSASNTLAAQAVLSCNINAASYQTGVVIRYERGTIAIAAPIYCPKSFTVQYFADGESGTVVTEETRRFEYVGTGWHFEADEVARCVRDGKAQSELWGHDKSMLEMGIFDEVRRQGGYKFPPGVEKVW